MADTLANAVFIGYMVGTKDVLGRSVQAVANLAGETVGQEIVKFAKSTGTQLNTIGDLESFLQASKLATISISENDDGLSISISDCGICPKRVGGYQFEGTACPWSGLLCGALSEILNQPQMASARLVPAEVCVIQIKKSS
jgi:predicted hydrocarbon binding protein